MCKHLMLLLATLMDKGVVEEGSNMQKYYKANYGNFKTEQRLSMSNYEKRLNEWKKDQKIKTQQRILASNMAGYKKSGYNSKTGKYSWQNKKPGGKKRGKK